MGSRVILVSIATLLTLVASDALILPSAGAATSYARANVARKAIQAIYDKEDSAADRKDLQGVFAQTAPDFSAVDENGQAISLAQAKANVAELFSHARSVKSTTLIEKFRLVGDTAIVTTKSRDVVQVTDPETGDAGRMVVDDLSVDTWVSTGKVWLQKRSHDIAQTVHRDPTAQPPAYDPMMS